MNFANIESLTSRFEFKPTTASTNSDLVAAVSADSEAWPHFSVIAADFQTEGRGRSGRTWQAPAGSSIFVSVLLKPSTEAISRFGWLPLLTGLAVRDTLAAADLHNPATVKWPNDVLIGPKKIAGVLSEFVSSDGAVVVGVGINLTQSQNELPVETATSLALEGVGQVDRNELLAAYLQNLRNLYDAWAASNFNAEKSGLRSNLLAKCSTIGMPVRAILPGDQELVGTAEDIDVEGRLVIRLDSNAAEVKVSAGDIVHLRHFGQSSATIKP